MNTKPLTDIRDIRKLLREAMRDDIRVDGKPPGNSPAFLESTTLLRRVEHAAHYQGLSGEDHMTLLAYHALIRVETLYDQLLDFHNIKLSPSLQPPGQDYPPRDLT